MSYANLVETKIFLTKSQGIVLDGTDGCIEDYMQAMKKVANSENFGFVLLIYKNPLCMYFRQLVL